MWKIKLLSNAEARTESRVYLRDRTNKERERNTLLERRGPELVPEGGVSHPLEILAFLSSQIYLTKGLSLLVLIACIGKGHPSPPPRSLGLAAHTFPSLW